MSIVFGAILMPLGLMAQIDIETAESQSDTLIFLLKGVPLQFYYQGDTVIFITLGGNKTNPCVFLRTVYKDDYIDLDYSWDIKPEKAIVNKTFVYIRKEPSYDSPPIDSVRLGRTVNLLRRYRFGWPSELWYQVEIRDVRDVENRIICTGFVEGEDITKIEVSDYFRGLITEPNLSMYITITECTYFRSRPFEEIESDQTLEPGTECEVIGLDHYSYTVTDQINTYWLLVIVNGQIGWVISTYTDFHDKVVKSVVR